MIAGLNKQRYDKIESKNAFHNIYIMDSSESITGDDSEYDIDFEPEEVDKIDTSALQPYQFEPEKSPCKSDEDEVTDEEESSDEESNDEITRIGSNSWCTCRLCRCMSTYEESLCCREDVPEHMFREVECITHHEDFATVCLNNVT